MTRRLTMLHEELLVVLGIIALQGPDVPQPLHRPVQNINAAAKLF